MKQRRPLLIDKSTDELLNEVNVEDDNSDVDEFSELEDASSAFLFLRNYKIRTGDIPIKKSFLYQLYKKSEMSPDTNTVFSKDVANYLECDNRYFYINIELNELVNTLNSSIRTVKSQKLSISQHDLKRFNDFLAHYNIKPGKGLYIDVKALYYFYDVWTYQNKYKTSNFNRFKKLINTHLDDPVFLTTSPSYGIGRAFYEKVSKEEIKTAKEWAKKFKPKKHY